MPLAGNSFQCIFCAKGFGFDNDEYFLAKLKDVLTHKRSDKFLKVQAYENAGLLISRLILEQQPLN
jgi:hypothetical protein